MRPEHILKFWFEDTQPKQYFKRDPEFDALIRKRFLDVHRAAAQGELYGWRTTPEGRLAEIIVLDQFSRNLFRDSPRAFACDGMALVLAQEAVSAGADRALPAKQRAFLYIPYMHSESSLVHREAERLFSQPGLEENLKFERKHRAIIEHFGRYPHRNAALGRESTPEEQAFLSEPGSSF